MLQWMIYVAIVTLVLSIAALSAERGLRLRGAATRWVWVVTILASLLMPTLIASVSFQVPQITASDAPATIVALRDVTSLPLTSLAELPVPAATSPSGIEWDARLKRYWLIASAAMLLALLASAAQLAWRKRRWTLATIAGVTVFTAPAVGPAVVGLIRPRIVVPRWLLESPASRQEIVIAHEKSHLEARDPLLLTLGLGLLVFMPWNVPLWWQVRRLRRAIEVDCDARVLRAGHDVSRYGEALIEVGRRQSSFVGSVAAMSESSSFLEQRLRIMLRVRNGRWKTAAALLGCASVCLVAVASQVSPPNSDAHPAADTASSQIDVAVYDAYAGAYRVDESIVLFVSRKGDRVLTRMTGQPFVENFPVSATEVYSRLPEARITFAVDGEGRATALTLYQKGRQSTFPRMSDALAQQIEERVNARVQSQAPNPGSEAALRRYYAGLTAGKPVYDEMTPFLAEMTRQNLGLVQSIPSQFGAIQWLQFRGVGKQGWDVYDARHEHGLAIWRIGLTEDGRIEGVLIQPGP